MNSFFSQNLGMYLNLINNYDMLIIDSGVKFLVESEFSVVSSMHHVCLRVHQKYKMTTTKGRI